MRDATWIARLRWRRLRDALTYVVRISLEYDARRRTTAERLYGLYVVIAISLLVLVPGWAAAMGGAVSLGQTLPAQARRGILDVLPVGVFLAQIVLMMVALRSSPLKLSFADVAYVAGSPMPRAAPMLVGFLFALLARLPVLAFAAALTVVTLTLPSSLGAATGVSLTTALGSLPLILFSWAVAWLAGAARVASPLHRYRFLWLVPLVALVPLGFTPKAVLWPGWTLLQVMRGEGVVGPLLLLTLLTLAVIGVLGWVSNRINMVVIARESRLYARLQGLGLGLLAQVLDPTVAPVVQQIRWQEKMAARKLLLRLPRASGMVALVTRAGLAAVRHPKILLPLPLWGAAASRGAALLLTRGPTELWLYWLTAVALTAPRSLTLWYRPDVEEPFLRQFLHANTLVLLVVDALLPLLLLLGGAVGAWMLQPEALVVRVAGIALTLVVAYILLLCQGVGLLTLTAYRIRVSPTLLAFLSIGLVVGSGVLLETLIAPLVASVAIAIGLSTLVATRSGGIVGAC